MSLRLRHLALPRTLQPSLCRFSGAIALAASLMAVSGCARTILIAQDTMVHPDRPRELVAYVDKQWLVVFTSGMAGREVRFFVDGEEVGRARTDKNGRARLLFDSDVSGHTFVARTCGDTRHLSENAYFYGWDPNRTGIAVDLDECISQTNYINLIWGDGLVSKPLDGSPEALHAIDEDYQILYYSARPRFMIRQTHEWLEKYGFPPGPIIFASDFSAALRQGSSKGELLASIREQWPNLRVGIGDKGADVDACVANNMLPIIVNGWRPKFRKNAIVVAGWESLPKFFEKNRHALADERRIAAFLASENRSASGDIIAPPEEPKPTRVANAGSAE